MAQDALDLLKAKKANQRIILEANNAKQLGQNAPSVTQAGASNTIAGVPVGGIILVLVSLLVMVVLVRR